MMATVKLTSRNEPSMTMVQCRIQVHHEAAAWVLNMIGHLGERHLGQISDQWLMKWKWKNAKITRPTHQPPTKCVNTAIQE